MRLEWSKHIGMFLSSLHLIRERERKKKKDKFIGIKFRTNPIPILLKIVISEK